MGAIIALVNKKGGNATETAANMLKILKYKSVEAFGIASPTIVRIESSIEALQHTHINSPIIIGHAFSRILTTDKPQPIKLEGATFAFNGRIYPTPVKVCEADVAAQKLQKNREETVETLIKEAKGDFALVVAELKRVLAGRSSMGVHPLYYGENMDFAALASERKALWRIGIKTAASFPPGHIALVDKSGFKFKPVKTLVYPKVKQIDMQSAGEKLQALLKHSVERRVSGLKEVALAFSGGLDSSIIALLAKNSGADVHLLYVSLKNQPEIEHAKKAAEKLYLPIHVYLYDEEDVEEVLPKVLWLIEEPDPVKAGIGIPFYWAAEKAAEMNFKVILAGQGADELFGGYKRYINDYLRYGDKKVRETIFNDIVKMYETNFERDFKVCNFHSVELRLPFATYQIAKFAAELPIKLKIEMREDGLRKLVLRWVGKNLGLPQFIVKRPKKAIQYTTGINKTLKRLAKRKRLTIKDYLRKTFQAVLKKMMEYE